MKLKPWTVITWGAFVLVSLASCALLQPVPFYAADLKVHFMGPHRFSGTDSLEGNHGRVNQVWVHPHKASELMAASPHGGLWHTTNRGQRWEPLTDSLQPAGVSAFAVMPEKSMRIIAAQSVYTNAHPFRRYTKRLMYSTDSGRTWQNSNLQFNPDEGTYIHALHQASDALWAASQKHLWQSKDGGANWHPVPLDLQKGQEIFNLEAAKDGLLVSGLKLAGFFNFQNHRWDTFSLPLEGNYRAHALMHKGKVAVVTTQWPGNKTRLWYVQTPNFQLQGKAIALPSTGRSFILHAASSPAGRLYAGGVHWYNLQKPEKPRPIRGMHVDIRDVQFSGDTLIFVAHDGGLSLLKQPGHKAQLIMGNMNHSQVYDLEIAPNGTLYAGCHDAGLFRQSSGGRWSKILTGDAGAVALGGEAPKHLYCINNKQLWWSSNGGKSWKQTRKTFRLYNPPLGATSTYPVVAGNWNILGQKDIGKPLDVLATGMKGNVGAMEWGKRVSYAALSYKQDGEMYSALWQAKLQKGDRKWNQVKEFTGLAGDNGRITALELREDIPETVWAARHVPGQKSNVYLSRNGGGQWYVAGKGLPALPVGCLYNQQGKGLWAGTEAGLYFLPRKSGQWQHIRQLPAVPVTKITAAKGSLWVATYGRGIFMVHQ